MNFKKSALASAITLATFATGAAAFDASSWEVSGFVKNETAVVGSGSFISQKTSRTDSVSHNDSGDVSKFENTAKVFVNGDVTENAAIHAEMNFVFDSEGTPNRYQDHMNYSQQDYLRELYVDTSFGANDDVEIRVGKQQVVWGTADGIKLLDIINPTDYREFAQNTMEDSRIPVWMLKADAFVGESGSVQFILSESRTNKIAGLSQSDGARSSEHASIGDWGNPFVMKGVDSITGKVNGFLNVGPAMGKVAAFFGAAAYGGADPTANLPYSGALANFSGATVGEFVTGGAGDANGFKNLNATGCLGGSGGSATTSARCLYETANSTATNSNFTVHAMGSNGDVTNLIDSDNDTTFNANWDTSNPNSMFEYMENTSFHTFTDFVNMKTEYRVSHDDGFDEPTLGFRYKGSTDSGLNYSFNAVSKIDHNPYVNVHWEDTLGNQLSARYTTGALAGGAGASTNATVVSLYDDTNSGTFTPSSAKQAVLVFEEKTNRIEALGGSFDSTLETDAFPVVLRGEFLYEKGVMTPVVDKAKLGIGDVVGALSTEKADFFKYVIGADVTLLTNMLVSGQFIQFRNLDYIDVPSYTPTGTDESGNSVTSLFSGARYSADPTTLHLTNGLQKARENKEFYSLFLSKPFGANQLGRWNNIFMFEEGGGKWNRFDVEYSFSDELVGSFELNNYWGDANTQFGQMEDSSNIQVGLKYLF
jgi:hypothetical protein